MVSFKPTGGRSVSLTTKENRIAFYVDGNDIPTVNFDVGPSWAGLIPVSSNANETRELYFWFFPALKDVAKDDFIIWLNGGPGCSSLEGFLEENGPISFQYGQFQATPNPYSWTNVSNMLWVDQPVGTGFSQGTPDATSEADVADHFIGFLEQFFSLFSELKGKRLWITGESYAGVYIPYIADAIYSQPSLKDSAGINLQGIGIFDAATTYSVIQEQIPTVPFVHKWNNVLNLNQSFIASIEVSCNSANYSEKYATYPPKGPLPDGGINVTAECDIYDSVVDAATTINPCAYHIFDGCPIPYDALGFPEGENLTLGPVFFDNPELQDAIHAPRINWTECSPGVFINDTDNSDYPSPGGAGVLTRVIDNNTRTLIGHGLLDMLLLSEGTRIMIQNLTFGGMQGFQTPITNILNVEGLGEMGFWHEERKLMYVEYALSGHMVAQYQPIPALKTIVSRSQRLWPGRIVHC
ncbi:hypothetical protein BOTBODRAFT_105475 [Botryobasidium botryosum FD-172 SS1]|uniref:Carboxypeptidase n=1 Tax=Botryobasidium botryosum (strain FD-172 SS1) TaxID=930990 RepID=A0A067N095_BOTB1|nr:hypothetical protein BOTBODRAFT_105475 [Botryobasidium botryosum FD-172 SS1]